MQAAAIEHTPTRRARTRAHVGSVPRCCSTRLTEDRQERGPIRVPGRGTGSPKLVFARGCGQRVSPRTEAADGGASDSSETPRRPAPTGDLGVLGPALIDLSWTPTSEDGCRFGTNSDLGSLNSG
jgi:hypothetical protein